LFNSHTKVLLLVKVSINKDKEMIFALPFGYGKYLLKDDVYEERLGIKTAVNIFDKDTIREISKVDISGTLKSSQEQMPKQSNIEGFGFNIESDLIKSITGKSICEDLISGNVTGNDYLSVNVDVDFNNVDSFLCELYQYYISDKYKQNFDWIDQITPINNKNLIIKLDNLMLNSILNQEPTFWMAVPEIINWDVIEGFKVPGFKDTVDDI